FVVRADCQTRVAGVGAHESSGPPIGVAQQLHLKLLDDCFRRRMLLQEGTSPRALSNALGALLMDLDLDSSLPLLALGHDGADGRVALVDGRPHVFWPQRLKSGYSEFAHGNLRELAKALDGGFRRPEMLGEKSVTVHPLGGCGMGDTPDLGVVNHLGQVFDPQAEAASRYPRGDAGPVHPGLYVADGAVLPTSLGVNPFFTIAALAEHIAAGIQADPQWSAMFA
ncbi:MAG: hypothetical protein KDA92_25690, partial [Planctomycetales bacterium]|nr:hypothetical protein [Planctomycetales bacterium]